MNKRWDHIIVGTGSAGAVVAARLSEDPTLQVLALEAGPDYPTVEETPQDIRNAFAVSVDKHDWHYTAEAIPGRVIPYARGKVTGGCSAINGTIVLRGLPSDYEEWAAAGCTGWGWRDVFPYLKRLEDDPIDAPFHGKGGPMPVTRTQEEELTVVQRAFTQACLVNGFAPVADHNDPEASGVGPIPMNRRGSLRISAALAYLTPEVRHRPNLTIQPHTLVTRILFEGTKAVGVEVKTWGRLEQIFGDHVTLSAGAVNDPAILWRSGVGPAEKLAPLGEPVVIDRPGVGENLVEHCQALVALIPKPGVVDPDSPDVQMLVHYTAPGGPANDMQIYCVNKLGRERFPELPPGASDLLYAAMICLNRPRSRGRIWLTNTDPEQPPHILLNLNTDPDDMRRMLSGVRRCWDIAHTGEFAALSQGVAGLTQAIIDDDALLASYIDANCGTIWHPVGTCKMSPASDPMAVVDAKLRVHGAQNLCIAGASVFYDHVSRNPLLTCLAIGERLAEWLRGEE